MAEPARILPSNDNQEDADARYASKPHLKVLEGSGQGDSVPEGSLKSVDNPKGDNDSKEPISNEEAVISNLGGEPDRWSYNPMDKRKKRFQIKSGSGKSLNSKWLVVGGVGGGLIVVALTLLIIFLSSLLVPDLAKNILAYQFARVGRQFEQDDEAVTAEDIAVQAASKSTLDVLAEKFGASPLLQKFRNLNYQNVIDDLEKKGSISFNYASNKLGVKTLQSVTINDETLPVNKVSIVNPIDSFNESVDLANKVNSLLQPLLNDYDVGLVVRGQTEKSIIDKLNVSLVAWSVSKFDQDQTSEEANVEQAREAQAAIDPNNETVPSVVSPINSAENQASSQLQSDLANDTTAEEIINNGGVDPNVTQILDSEVNNLNSPANSALSLFNGAYAIFMPLCIIYDGSLQSSSGAQTVQDNSNQDERSFFYLESADDQEESGQTTANAVGALTNKIGNDGESNPEIRASGGTVDTSKNSISPQTAGNGQFSALNLILPSSVADFINSVESNTNFCQIITNPAVALGTTAVNIGLWFGSDGSEAEIQTAAEEGVDSAMAGIIGKLAGKIAESIGADEGANVGAKAAVVSSKLLEAFKPNAKTLASVAGITGLDFLVRLDTLSKMDSELNNGLSEGNDFANQADAGGNLNANQLMQQQFYGAPLSPIQTAYNYIEDSKYLAANYKEDSLYNRYLSISNPESLISKLGMAIDSDLNLSKLSSFVSSSSRIFQPMTLITNVFKVLDPSAHAMADSVTTSDDSDYGIVQWGFTDQELSLMNEQTYRPLENDAVLAQYPIQVQYIQQNYQSCFTDNMSTMLTSTPNNTITNYSGPNGGTNFITRQTNGDVISGPTGGICTQYFLGPQSADPRAFDPGDSTNDLIFRWRLQQAYYQETDALTGVANVGSSQ